MMSVYVTMYDVSFYIFFSSCSHFSFSTSICFNKIHVCHSIIPFNFFGLFGNWL